MAEFADVAKARESYKVFAEAMRSGREILRRAGVPDPPPVPEFDTVFRRMDATAKETLYAELRRFQEITPQDAIRLWTPLIKQAFLGKGLSD